MAPMGRLTLLDKCNTCTFKRQMRALLTSHLNNDRCRNIQFGRVCGWQDQKTRGELLRELKQKGFAVRGHYKMKKLRQFANHYDLPLEIREELIKPGWVGASKGLLQVLWERGFVDETRKMNIH